MWSKLPLNTRLICTPCAVLCSSSYASGPTRASLRLRCSPPVSGLEESCARLGTLLVLLGGGTARPYCSNEFIALDGRHGTPGG